MTKQEVRRRLFAGETLDSIFAWIGGQDCDIFKADDFKPGDEIIYIPDIYLNEIPTDINLSIQNSMMDASDGEWGPMTVKEQVEFALSYCYTGDDFVELCKERYGDGERAVQKAEELFWYVDWQHPSSALDAGELDDDDEEV